MWAVTWFVIYIYANWLIFEKAGEKGWKSLIPIYGGYVLYRLTWRGGYFWLNLILASISYWLRLAGGGNDAMLIFAGICGLVVALISLDAAYHLSSAFGYGWGFAIGLVLLNPIFVMILGFGRATCVGCDPYAEVPED